jgi:hypothetical protein
MAENKFNLVTLIPRQLSGSHSLNKVQTKQRGKKFSGKITQKVTQSPKQAPKYCDKVSVQ